MESKEFTVISDENDVLKFIIDISATNIMRGEEETYPPNIVIYAVSFILLLPQPAEQDTTMWIPSHMQTFVGVAREDAIKGSGGDVVRRLSNHFRYYQRLARERAPKE